MNVSDVSATRRTHFYDFPVLLPILSVYELLVSNALSTSFSSSTALREMQSPNTKYNRCRLYPYHPSCRGTMKRTFNPVENSYSIPAHMNDDLRNLCPFLSCETRYFIIDNDVSESSLFHIVHNQLNYARKYIAHRN